MASYERIFKNAAAKGRKEVRGVFDASKYDGDELAGGKSNPWITEADKRNLSTLRDYLYDSDYRNPRREKANTEGYAEYPIPRLEDVYGGLDEAGRKWVDDFITRARSYRESERKRREGDEGAEEALDEEVKRRSMRFKDDLPYSASQDDENRQKAEADFMVRRQRNKADHSVSAETSKAYHARTPSGRLARGILTFGASEIMEAQRRREEERRRQFLENSAMYTPMFASRRRMA